MGVSIPGIQPSYLCIGLLGYEIVAGKFKPQLFSAHHQHFQLNIVLNLDSNLTVFGIFDTRKGPLGLC